MRYRLIVLPKLNCETCQLHLRQYGKTTLCNNGKNLERCDIGDIAPNVSANILVNAFIQAKMSHARGYPEMQNLLLEEYGLYNDPDLLFMLDNVWNDYIKYEQGKANTHKKPRK